MQSVVKQNLHAECEGDINKLINLKLNASYTYLALGMYFDRDDVALPKFSSFFLERSMKEREQTEKLLEYQNMRGGRILLQTISLCDYLEQNFLIDSHDTIKKLGDYIGSLTRITASETHGPMGEYLFDKHTL
ncbi:hypothetical protein F7725_014204 [Scomber scombrus]|uniref:Ferritin n=1 Tax=Scomber scombrus TaxID=13677 RepID=A0AAV1NXS6_SCOSC